MSDMRQVMTKAHISVLRVLLFRARDRKYVSLEKEVNESKRLQGWKWKHPTIQPCSK